MAHSFKTGGRKAGTPNKRTAQIKRLAEKAAAEGIMPLEYMLAVMRDETKPVELRCDMAKAAAPYLHAKRAPEGKASETVPYTLVITRANDEDEEPRADSSILPHNVRQGAS